MEKNLLLLFTSKKAFDISSFFIMHNSQVTNFRMFWLQSEE